MIKMFEEIFQQAGKHTDMLLAYGWKYWYISLVLLFFCVWFASKYLILVDDW